MSEESIKKQKPNYSALLGPLSTESRVSAIYEVIREGIIAGVWLPGDRINDKELADELGVSRISVREALSKLTEQGSVDRIQWKGYFLKRITLTEIKSIVEIRIALEELAIRNAMPCGRDLLERLEKALQDAQEALDACDHIEYMRRDFKFHDLIHEASGNIWIGTIIGNLRVIINILRNLSMMEDFKSIALRSMAGHRKILREMVNINLGGALQELRNHMKDHYEDIVAQYNKHYSYVNR